MLAYIVVGLALGSIYAICSAGLIITYVSTGVLNFAFGSIAFLVARIYYFLHTQQGWSIPAAAAVSLLVFAPLFGTLTYLLLLRFLRGASVLLTVVVTVGVSVAIPPIVEIIFGELVSISAPGLAPVPVGTIHVFGAAVTYDQLIVYGCLIVVVVIGGLILRFTDLGLTIRAMVDSEAMTSLSGVNPNRISVGVWAVSTFMAGLVGVLAAPVTGLDANSFTLLMAASFAAVVAAKLRNLLTAVVVSLFMGVAGSLIQYLLPSGSAWTAAASSSIPFIIIIVFVGFTIIRRGTLTEGAGGGGLLDRAIRPNGTRGLSSSASAEHADPLPILHHRIGPALIFLLALSLPFWLPAYWGGLVGAAASTGIIFLAYTLVSGEGGMIWLSIITTAGIGATTAAQLTTSLHWPVLVSILVSGVICGIVGAALGLLMVRLGDLYIALVTLTFGLLVESIWFTRPFIDNLGAGVSMPRPNFASSDRDFAIFALLVFGLISVAIGRLRATTPGLALNAVRWSEPASRTIGLKVVILKVALGGAAAFVAGIGGAFSASYASVALPGSYSVLLGMVWLAVLVTNGIRSNTAALIAAFSFVYLPAIFLTYLTNKWALVPTALFGVGAVMVARNPDGVVGLQAQQILSLIVRLGRRKVAERAR